MRSVSVRSRSGYEGSRGSRDIATYFAVSANEFWIAHDIMLSVASPNSPAGPAGCFKQPARLAI
jgi:hypothetical protein